MKNADYRRIAALKHADDAPHAPPIGLGWFHLHEHLVALHGAIDLVRRNKNVFPTCRLARIGPHKAIAVAAGKTTMEALRCLKRRLSDIVYKQMLADAKRLAAGPGGHAGASLHSSAAESHPGIGTSDKSLPGPATSKLRTGLPAAS